MPAGAFQIRPKNQNFNLKPKGAEVEVPDDQRKISHDVYETRNILKFLKDQGVFADDKASFDEYITRVIQAAEVGCTAKQVDTRVAAEALAQIRLDVVRRKGTGIMLRYMYYLLLAALLGVLVGLVIVLGKELFDYFRWAWKFNGLTGYGWVIIGSMAGAWFTVGVARWQLSFESLQDFVDFRYEPFIRMLFVVILACVVGLFLQNNLLTLKIGGVDLNKFSDNWAVALLLGFVAGIGEKALSVNVVAQVQKVLPKAS